MKGIGLGFRREIAQKLIDLESGKPDFIEFAPENWIGMGGVWRKRLEAAAEKYPIAFHGLSLSIGSPDDLDFEFLKKVKAFIKEFNVQIYSEHLSYSKCDNAHLYDLLPIPFKKDAVNHVVERIKVVQDYLEMPLTIENVSYYTPVCPEMSEAEFISAIVSESNCNLLLDVNNVYVNAFNHKYIAEEFILQLPLHKVGYIHMAGHEKISPDVIIDTHGKPIIDPVYKLFEFTVKHLKPVPVLLERDFNIPEISELQIEMSNLKRIAEKNWIGIHA